MPQSTIFGSLYREYRLRYRDNFVDEDENTVEKKSHQMNVLENLRLHFSLFKKTFEIFHFDAVCQ